MYTFITIIRYLVKKYTGTAYTLKKIQTRRLKHYRYNYLYWLSINTEINNRWRQNEFAFINSASEIPCFFMKMIIMHMYKHMLCMHYNIITTRSMTIFLWTEIIIILIFCRCLIEFKKPGSSVPSWLHYKTHIKYNRLHQKVYIWIAISHAMVVLRQSRLNLLRAW